MRKNILKFITISILLSISTLARAHVGTGSEHGGFLAGFTHPLLGWDHLIAMLSIGLWAGQHDDKTLWAAPLAFIAFMVVGIFLGVLHINLPMQEQMILASLIVFGILIALSINMNILIAMFAIGTFAIFHGHVHGNEIAADASVLLYTIGFISATALLHITGIIIAKSKFFNANAYISRITGGSIVATGIAGITLMML